MPVSFSVANHPAKPVKHDSGLTGSEILARAAADQYRKSGEMLEFGLAGTTVSTRDFTTKIPDIIPSNNGFFHTVLTAYNNHHALVIRPDDVWLAILCQFNFFVNANAELLRASFVAHDGKRELLVEDSTGKFDFGDMARQMAGLVDKEVSDPTLRDWALPGFTTTTKNDTTVASVLLMATLKQYFSYGFRMTGCGIPRVTLEGEKSDWVDILGRLEKLKEYGLETIAWYHLLRPVLVRFVAAFDAPESVDNVKFWGKVVHHHGGSGTNWYSGWVNAFNAFSKTGKWLGNPLETDVVSSKAPELMNAETFWVRYAKLGVRRDLVYDGTPYHRIDRDFVPPGLAEVDVTLTLEDGVTKFACVMVAGTVGTQVSSSGDVGLSEDGKDDVVRPVAGWWMFKERKLVKSE